MLMQVSMKWAEALHVDGAAIKEEEVPRSPFLSQQDLSALQ